MRSTFGDFKTRMSAWRFATHFLQHQFGLANALVVFVHGSGDQKTLESGYVFANSSVVQIEKTPALSRFYFLDCQSGQSVGLRRRFCGYGRCLKTAPRVPQNPHDVIHCIDEQLNVFGCN
jgi:hypothetical protein